MNIPFDMFDINPGRTLFTKDKGRVMSRFLTEHRRPEWCAVPSLDEVRWSDDYRYVYVQKTSGLIACGFDSMYPDHMPVVEDQNWAIFDDANPAARSLLHAIKEVLT